MLLCGCNHILPQASSMVLRMKYICNASLQELKLAKSKAAEESKRTTAALAKKDSQFQELKSKLATTEQPKVPTVLSPTLLHCLLRTCHRMQPHMQQSIP